MSDTDTVCKLALTALEVDIVRAGLELLMGRVIDDRKHELMPPILTLLTCLSVKAQTEPKPEGNPTP